MRNKKAKRLRRLARKLSIAPSKYIMDGGTRHWNVGCVSWWHGKLKGRGMA
jgi:hypothetical protein